MDQHELAKLAQRWTELFTGASATIDPDLPLVTVDVNDVVRASARDGWVLIKYLIEGAPSEQVLCDIGAGPLELFLITFGRECIRAIEEEARANSRLVRALSCVWETDIDSDTWGRLQTILRNST